MPLKDIQLAHQIISENKNTSDNSEDIQAPLFQLTSPSHQKSNMDIKRAFLENWFISEQVIINNLLSIAGKIAHLNSFSVYTDGSNQDFNGCNIMGLGWVIPATNDIINNIEFRCTMEQFPSSTKAEIMAMLTVIAVAPTNCNIEIFSDSQGAINIINNIISASKEEKIKSNDNNMILTYAAKQIIQDLGVKISLVKVKAHSGVKFNEIADGLAQVSITSPFQDPRICINSSALNQIKTVPMWNGLVSDYSIKTVIKKFNSEIWRQKWLRQNRIRWWIRTNKAKNINWDMTWKTIHPSKISSLISSSNEASIRRFSLKLLNDELPTLSNLNKRNPSLYTTDICPFCQLEIENNIHVFTCSSQTNINLLIELKSKFIQIVIYEVANILQQELNLDSLKKKLGIYTSDFELRNQHLMEFDQICFLDIIAGIVPNSLVTLSKEIMGNDKDSHLVILRSIRKFKIHLFDLWKYRCDKIIIWEKSQNIRTKDKKVGRKKFQILSTVTHDSTELRVYDDLDSEQYKETDTLYTQNNNIDYVSGDIRNSLHTAVVHAKQWLYAKFLNGVSKKGTSRFYKTN